VLYGSARGLTAAGDQLWSQDGEANRGDIIGSPEGGDLFGEALASGDFNGDGADDLAVGVPFEDLGGTADAGFVNVLYGRRFFGLDAPGNQSFDQDSAGLTSTAAETDDRFGQTLAVGDFNGDGRDDLAVGVPLEDIGSTSDAGIVQILYGSEGGILGKVAFDTANVAVVTEDVLNLQLVIKRLGPTNLAVTVDHRLASGASATAGQDFTYTPGTFSWPIGDASDRTILVQVREDVLAERTEFLTIELANPSAGTALASPSRRTVQINDDGDVLVFSDGFESGNTSAWAARVP
jgi:hypothetical protein